jgi:two-component system chemotaxis response regulator CheB
MIQGIPVAFRGTVLVAIHRSAGLPGGLAPLLERAGSLPASFARDGESMRPGHVHVAPPDRHLLVSGDSLRVTSGPREHGFRPAVDPLFRTAAREQGPRVVGVVLSGVLDDGTAGLSIIKRHGGVAIVQRTGDAEFDGMPASALHNVDVDHVLAAADIGPLLWRLSVEPVSALPGNGHPDVAAVGGSGLRQPPTGVIQPFSCPECGGALWRTAVKDSDRFQCHVGHAFTERTLAALQDGRLESALWIALRNLEETAALRRRLASRARGAGLPAMAEAYEQHAAHAESRADALRALLLDPEPPLDVPETASPPSPEQA